MSQADNVTPSNASAAKTRWYFRQDKRWLVKIVLLWGGLVPCLILGPLWVMGLIYSVALIFGKPHMYRTFFFEAERPLLLFFWGLSGLSGLLFFTRAYMSLKKRCPWKKRMYVMSVHALVGYMAFGFILYDISWLNSDRFITVSDIIILCVGMTPILAARLAYLSRYRASLPITALSPGK